jgi:hypothetical protein
MEFILQSIYNSSDLFCQCLPQVNSDVHDAAVSKIMAAKGSSNCRAKTVDIKNPATAIAPKFMRTSAGQLAVVQLDHGKCSQKINFRFDVGWRYKA